MFKKISFLTILSICGAISASFTNQNLIDAVKAKDPKKVEEIAKSGKVDLKNNDALILALLNPDYKDTYIASILLRYGADPNMNHVTEFETRSVLEVACKTGNLDATFMLIVAGANPLKNLNVHKPTTIIDIVNDYRYTSYLPESNRNNGRAIRNILNVWAQNNKKVTTPA